MVYIFLAAGAYVAMHLPLPDVTSSCVDCQIKLSTASLSPTHVWKLASASLAIVILNYSLANKKLSLN